MSSNSLQFEPLTPRIGAEVHGIDLSQPMTDDTFDALHDGGKPGAVLAPSSDGGTAALLRAPHDAIPACFGRDSARLHRAAAEAAGITLREISLPSLSLDLDCAEDLEAFARLEGQGAQTRTLLRSMGWGKLGDA